MNIKKFVAGVLSFCVVAGAVPVSAVKFVDNSIVASAADYTEGTYESLTYQKYDDYVVISGCDESAESVDIPAEIEGLPVTEIGFGAFRNCSSLTNVTIPDSVTKIGDYAFSGTPWFENKREENPLVIVNNILIDGSTCEGDIIIPDSVTTVGGRAFYESKITSIVLPESVTKIEALAFGYCESLKDVTILNANCDIHDWHDIGMYDSHIFYDGYYNESLKPILHGYDDSTAQAYAEKFSLEFVIIGTDIVLGDVNGDNLIDASDASQILAIYSVQSTGGTPVESAEQLLSADVNGDGLTDASDASTILAYYAYVSTGGTDNIETFMANNV